MMHELSQGAGYLKWFEEFPYGYYHADTTPLYIIAVRDYVRASGDEAMAKDFWPSLRKAYDYCASTDEDGDGLMDNTKAGLAAVETGTLRRRDVLTDVFLGAAWTEAADAAAELAELAGDPFAATAKAAGAKARQSLNARFLDDQGRRIYFAYMKDGRGQAEPTVWPGFGLWRGVFDTTRPAVAGALDDLAGAGVGADWGARMLSIDSALYGPLSYNNGASWPFLTGFAALGLYANGRPDAAWTYLDGTADLTFIESRGYMAELFSGDRLRSIDAAVPHQLFATTGFMSTLMRGLAGMNALPAGTLDGRPVPARLQLAPQLPAGWGWLKIRNLRWHGVSADVTITRDASGLAFDVSPRGGTLPIEMHAILPPGSRQMTRDMLWRPATPGADASRGLHLVRLEQVSARASFTLRATPGVRLLPLHAPLALGDLSSRLRIIDATLDGEIYTVRVEGRRGRSYQVRLLGPPVLSVQGATLLAPPAGTAARSEGHLLGIVMPAADPAAAGAVLKRSDWAAATIVIRLGDRRP